MNARFSTVLATSLAGTLVVSVPQARFEPAPTTALPARQVVPEPFVPGTLGGLRTSPIQPVLVGAADLQAPELPAVWELDLATGAYYRSGEALVRFREGSAPDVRAQSMAAVGAGAAEILPDGWERVRIRPGLPAAAAVAALRDDLAIAAATLDYRLTTFQQRPNDELYSLQWNFDAIDLPRAWEINPGARTDVIVAVVDTGLNIATNTVVFTGPNGRFSIRFAAVPDLVTDGRIVAPYDFVYDDALPVDLGGHGTHVAGTIGQQTNNIQGLAGVAYNVRLMPLKVISGGEFLYAWDDLFAPGNRGGSSSVVAEAIRYAADNGARIINLSLGSQAPLPLVDEAIRYAVEKGAFVAIAAGNAAEEGNPVEYPAAYGSEIEGAVTVGAVNRGLRRSPYSSFHSYVEICAPGGQLMSPIDYEGGITQVSYNQDATLPYLDIAEKLFLLRRGFQPRFDLFEPVPFEGTSMATPHVTGIAALLYSQGITDPGAIEEALKRFARPIDATADECGAGLVDPRRALRGLGLAQ